MLKIRYIFLFLIFFPFVASAQNDTIKYEVGLFGVASSGTYSSFWLQNNRYGAISNSPVSADGWAGISKDFTRKSSLFDYGFKANILLQTDQQKTHIYFQEFYAKARLSVFDLVIGARKEQLGNQDSSLSCGGFLFSRNARPMPKVTVGIEHFTPVPFTNGYLEVKGAISHGWFTDNIYVSNLLLHHKYLYARIGGRLPVHIQYGIDHVAQWGGVTPDFQQPKGFSDFVDIFFGRSGGKNALETDQINALGNHIVSQSMRLDANIWDFKVSGYWQNLSEDGPIRVIWNSMTIRDGLWGFTIRNSKIPFIKGLLYEYLNTSDQSGPYHDKDGLIYGGTDNYLNNGVYQNGWSYFSRTIGTPLITSPVYNRDGTVSILNNRVQVHHFGIEGNIAGYEYKYLMTVSKNYGTYYGLIATDKINNTSLLLEVKKDFPTLNHIQCAVSVGADVGKMYGNSVGCMFSIRKIGNLFQY